jgi:recombination protein RecA
MTKATDKARALVGALFGLERRLGDGAGRLLGGGGRLPPAPLSSGSLGLDVALGGGLPPGRLVELFGPESGGKTTLALHAIARAQRAGATAALIDTEHAFDVRYAARLGIDVRSLVVSQPDHGEQALAIAEQLCRSGAVDLLVLDSVAALVPRAELEGELGSIPGGLHERLLGQGLRSLSTTLARTGGCGLFLNQLRRKPSVLAGGSAWETTTAGNALHFYASVRLEVGPVAALGDGGRRTRARVVKNKLAAAGGEAHFDLLRGGGISREGELVDLAAARGLLETWGERGARPSRESAVAGLCGDARLLEALEAAVRSSYGLR